MNGFTWTSEKLLICQQRSYIRSTNYNQDKADNPFMSPPPCPSAGAVFLSLNPQRYQK